MVFKLLSLEGKAFFNETDGCKAALVRGARVKPSGLQRGSSEPRYLLHSIDKEWKINLLFFLVNLSKVSVGLKILVLQMEYLHLKKCCQSLFPSF